METEDHPGNDFVDDVVEMDPNLFVSWTEEEKRLVAFEEAIHRNRVVWKMRVETPSDVWVGSDENLLVVWVKLDVWEEIHLLIPVDALKEMSLSSGHLVRVPFASFLWETHQNLFVYF